MTIHGYITDGDAYHPACLPEGVKPEEDPEVTPLYSWTLDEWEDGLSCGGCTEWIAEPADGEEDETSDEIDWSKDSDAARRETVRDALLSLWETP